MTLDNYRKTLIAALVVLAGAFGIGVFALGAATSRSQYFIFNAFFSLMACGFLFGVLRNSKASIEGDYYGWKVSLTGGVAGAVAIGGGLYFITPPPEVKAITFVVTQGNGLYKGHCTIEYQIGTSSRASVDVNDGATTINGIPTATKSVKVWSVAAVGKTYLPSRKTGSPPWQFDLDDSNNVTIDLPLPVVKECVRPSIEELKAQLTTNRELEKAKKALEKTKGSAEREEIKKKAKFRVVNTTQMKIDVIGIDYRKLFEEPDALNLEDSDWLDFFEFSGKKENEAITYNHLSKMKNTSGLFFLFACIAAPDGHVEIPLGPIDLLGHEISNYRIIMNGDGAHPVVLLPDTETNP
jgi:hypothetical protein